MRRSFPAGVHRAGASRTCHPGRYAALTSQTRSTTSGHTSIEECPVDCIYEGDRMLYIHPDECVDCGACEPVCPVEAIFYEDDVPAQWTEFTAANAAFFTEGEEPLGSPGGAANVGAVLRDAGFVANYQVSET
jgi:ferredoxin